MVYLGLGAAATIGVLSALSSKSPRLTRKMHLGLIGDSLAVGLSTPLTVLSKCLGNQFSYATQGGTRIDQWAKDPRLDQLLLSKPDLVLVSLGTNDEYTWKGDLAAKDSLPLGTLLSKIRSAGAEVAWIGPPSLPISTKNVEGLIRPRVDYYFDSTQVQFPRTPDGIHATAKGYAVWAGALWNWMSAPGCSTPRQ